MRSAINIKPSDTINLTFTGGLGILGGLWLIISPFLFGYNSLLVFYRPGSKRYLAGDYHRDYHDWPGRFPGSHREATNYADLPDMGRYGAGGNGSLPDGKPLPVQLQRA